MIRSNTRLVFLATFANSDSDDERKYEISVIEEANSFARFLQGYTFLSIDNIEDPELYKYAKFKAFETTLGWDISYLSRAPDSDTGSKYQGAISVCSTITIRRFGLVST